MNNQSVIGILLRSLCGYILIFIELLVGGGSTQILKTSAPTNPGIFTDDKMNVKIPMKDNIRSLLRSSHVMFKIQALRIRGPFGQAPLRADSMAR